jgi:GT2 family glycosyltransferase
VIVTYNSEQVIETCLEALHNMAPSVAAIVVDNGSADDSAGRAGRWPGVRVIANRENRGFAAAANQGIRASKEEFILLLNPDVQLRTPLDMLILACERYGVSAGLLTDKTGNPQKGFAVRGLPTPVTLIFELLGLNRVWPSNPVNRRYRCLDLDLSRPSLVEQPAGAFLMFRRDVWESLSGLDERFYPVWFEDVDFCLRARQAGFQIQFVPEVQAVHAGGHSVLKIPAGCRTRYWYDSLLRYGAKHFGAAGLRGVCLAALLSSIPRAVAGMIWERSLAPVRAHFKIVRFAGKCLVSNPKPAERQGSET